jgi:hypothetical protein
MCSGSWSWSSSKKRPSLVVVNLKRQQLQKTPPPTPPRASVAIRRKRYPANPPCSSFPSFLCSSFSSISDSFLQSHKYTVHVRRLRLRRLRAGAEAMEMVNLKLYLENRCIIAENERLRERASALRRENLALLQDLSKTPAVPEAGAGAGAA